MAILLHITTSAEWAAALVAGSYHPASLTAEGFIHCSTYAQAPATAARYFRGREDLVLLCIDEARLTVPLRYEAPPGRPDEHYPHLYGPLAPSAVIAVVKFPPGPDGLFRLPDNLP